MSEKMSDNIVKEKNSFSPPIEQENVQIEQQSDENSKEKQGESCKKYAIITPEVRMSFIKRVLSKHSTIREAAQEFGIKFSTSKAILQTFRREGRIGKKKFRNRKSKHTGSKPELSEENLQQRPQSQQLKQRFSIRSLEDNIEPPQARQSEQKLEINQFQGPQRPSDRTLDQYFMLQHQMMQQPMLQMNPMMQMNFMGGNPYDKMREMQMIQQQMSLVQIQKELEYQKQVNQQLMRLLGERKDVGQHQMGQQQPFYTKPSRNEHFGRIKEEEQYVTPLQSIRNLDGQFQAKDRKTFRDL